MALSVTRTTILLPLVWLVAVGAHSAADAEPAWERAAEGYETRATGPDPETFCQDRDFPDSRAFGDRNLLRHCTRIGSYSRMQALFRHNTMPAGRGVPWEREAFERHFRPALLRQIDAYLDRFPATSFLILRDGRTVLERYQYGRKPTDRFASFSVAKSLIGMLVGLAVEEGRIASIDDPVGKYADDLPDSWKRASIRDVLRMSSGVKWEPDGDTRRHVSDLLYRTKSLPESLAAFRETDFPPGSRFQYNNANTSVLTLILHRVYGRKPSQVFAERIWSQIGAEHDAYWLADADGIDVGLGYFNATTRDYARLGQLVLDGGVARDGRRILPADWLARQAGAEVLACPFAPGCIGGKWGYGYQTWLLPDGLGPFFWGKFGQLVIVLPALRTVIVQTGVADKPTFSDELLAIIRAMPGQVLR